MIYKLLIIIVNCMLYLQYENIKMDILFNIYNWMYFEFGCSFFNV